MTTETMMREELQRLYALESGLVRVFDLLDGRARCRKVGVTIVSMVEIADRHLSDLGRMCDEAGWTPERDELPMVRAWREEVEDRVLLAPSGEAADALTLSLLRRAIHLKLPCYESARLLAFYAERLTIARTLRFALEDEQACLERLRSAAELGVSLRAALGSSA